VLYFLRQVFLVDGRFFYFNLNLRSNFVTFFVTFSTFGWVNVLDFIYGGEWTIFQCFIFAFLANKGKFHRSEKLLLSGFVGKPFFSFPTT